MEDRVGLLLKLAQHALRGAMDDRLRPLGATTPQYAALTALARAGGASNADLARRCFVTPQTMNEILATLAGQGQVSRRDHPTNRRVQVVELTAAGRDKLARCDTVVAEVEAKMVAGLTEAEVRGFADLLRRCADALESDA